MQGFCNGSVGKNPPAIQEAQKMWVRSWARKIPWRRKWQSTQVFLPGKFHGQRSLAGLQSMGSQKVRHDRRYLHFHIYKIRGFRQEIILPRQNCKERMREK